MEPLKAEEGRTLDPETLKRAPTRKASAEDLQGALGRQALAECAPKVEAGAPRKSPKRERERERERERASDRPRVLCVQRAVQVKRPSAVIRLDDKGSSQPFSLRKVGKKGTVSCICLQPALLS